MLFDLLDLHFFAKTKVYFPESSWSKPTEKITSRCTARKFNCFLTEGIFWPSIIPKPCRDLPAPRDVQFKSRPDYSTQLIDRKELDKKCVGF